MRWVAALLALGLAGCASTMLDHFVGRVDGPPAFQQGYRDGCASGMSAAGMAQMHFTKDVGRTNAEPLYGQGWEDGFRVCKTRARS